MLGFVTPFNAGLAGFLVNWVGVLTCNGFFTWSEAIAKQHPTFWSTPSQVLVLVWGLSYLAVGLDAQASGATGGNIWLAFAVEKSVYVYQWLSTYKRLGGPKNQKRQLEAFRERDVQKFAVNFLFGGYGVLDFLLMVAFLVLGFR